MPKNKTEDTYQPIKTKRTKEDKESKEAKPGTSGMNFKNQSVDSTKIVKVDPINTIAKIPEGTPKNSEKQEDRYAYNYWGIANSNEAQVVTVVERGRLRIKDLVVGKYDDQSIYIRLTYKSEMKDTKIGKVVTFMGMDETSEIGIICFGKFGIELHNVLENNHVYIIQNFNVQNENVNYARRSGNKLQIKINQDCVSQRIEDESILPPITFLFKSIVEIKASKRNTRIDLIGILVKDFGLEVNNNNNSIRDLSITDDKKPNIIATLWGLAAENFKFEGEAIIVIRKGIVGEFQENKKINCIVGTLVWINPNIPEAHKIAKWFNESNK